MTQITSSPLMGVLLCVGAYSTALYIRHKTRSMYANPFVVATILIILFLSITGIPYSHFKAGGDLINMFLSPVTVILAVPLYLHRNMLNRYYGAIAVGISTGVIAALVSILAISRLCDMGIMIEKSMISKSITAPIGIEITQMIGGIEGITVLSIISTGFIGAIFAPVIFKVLGIKHDVAKGVSIGVSSHAIGTSKALEMGERIGAMSSLTIGIAGIATVVMVGIMDMFLWD
ncbi:MAG: LrgB family protein [Flavobacteriales bacterium]|nr:LrgB family protein [Flavobacteriales bacterium]